MNSDLYRKTLSILNNINNSKISIKSAIYNDTNIVNDRNFRKIYKLVNEIMKNRFILEEIIDNFYADMNIKNKELFKIMLYEFFFSQQKKKMGGKLMKQIKQKSDIIKNYLNKKDKLNEGLNVKQNSQYYSNSFITFRMNKNKIADSGMKVDDIFKEIGCEEIKIKYDELYVLNKSKANLELLFRFADKGLLIFQNESSFLPVYILTKVVSSLNGVKEVIDSCAAPGNKTLQLADLFNKSRVTAFEKDQSRFKTLVKRVNIYNFNKNISVKNEDFLNINPNDYPDVQVVLCDPSCSGSGTLNNVKADNNNLSCCLEIAGSEIETKEADRLKRLSKFQEKIVLQAMRFPKLYTYKI